MIALEKHSSTAKQDCVTANSHQLSSTLINSYPCLIRPLGNIGREALELKIEIYFTIYKDTDDISITARVE